MRVCNSRCAPRLVHCICWRLTKRLLATYILRTNRISGRREDGVVKR
jgi:hypothetical protein